MTYDEDQQCNECHELWNPEFLENGTCIECVEIAEFGISMSEALEFEYIIDDNYPGLDWN